MNRLPLPNGCMEQPATLQELYAAGSFAAARALAERLLHDQPRNAEAMQVLGLVAYSEGRFADAVGHLRSSLAAGPHAAASSNLGAALRANGQLADAETAYRQALTLQPDCVDAGRNLAYLLIAAGRLAEAEPVLAAAVRHAPAVLDLWRTLAGVAQTLRRHAEAARSWRAILALAPGNTEAAFHLAGCLWASGDLPGAETVLRAHLVVAGDDAGILARLGGVLAARGCLQDADDAFARSLTISPLLASAHADRSDVLRRMGLLGLAEQEARQALQIQPQLDAAAVNLGNALGEQQRHREAETAFDLAIQLRPDCAEAYNGRGLSRLRRGAPMAAEADFRRVLQMRPDLAVVGTNLGLAMLDQGQPAAALDALRTAADGNPKVDAARRALLFCLNYDPGLTGEAIAAECRAWGAALRRSPQRVDLPATTPDPPEGDDRTGNAARQANAGPTGADVNPDRSDTVCPGDDETAGVAHRDQARSPARANRRLRIGYVSPDFRTQSASFFILPLLAAHDRNAVELFCYAELASADATTGRLRALTEHWRPTIGLSDADVASLIRSDRIDVLVDMGGHTTNSRIAAFAHKPAPVQIEYLLGHGATSGLPEMDVFLADSRLVPPGSEHLFNERVVRLNRIPLAYAPPDFLPDVGPLPALAQGYVTFGHFGRLARIHGGVVAAWSQILRAVPGSRLVLNSAPFNEPALRQSFNERFARCGIAAHRLDLLCTRPQQKTFEAYGAVDIALDPFPHNAGTTTIEALWMGVPVVSLQSRPSVGRFGACILHAVGLDDWAVSSLADYVDRAALAATDLEALSRLRATLRTRCLASPLNDAPGLAREMEAVFRTLRNDAEGATTLRAPVRRSVGNGAAPVPLLRRRLRSDPST